MPGSLFVNNEDAASSSSNAAYSSSVTLSTLNRDGSRSAFTPYRVPSTVLTNLQRGNVQTQTLSVLPERSIHQLAAQGELFIQNVENFDVDQKDQNGLTPLMWAAGYGQLDTVRKLLALGASISLIGSNGENSLILACASGYSTIVKELINHGSSLDYKDPDGNTALMYAAFNNHGGCVQELLNAGADMTLTNEALESAFDIAIKRRSKQAQAILEKYMLNLLHVDVDGLV